MLTNSANSSLLIIPPVGFDGLLIIMSLVFEVMTDNNSSGSKENLFSSEYFKGTGFAPVKLMADL